MQDSIWPINHNLRLLLLLHEVYSHSTGHHYLLINRTLAPTVFARTKDDDHQHSVTTLECSPEDDGQGIPIPKQIKIVITGLCSVGKN